MSKTKVYISGPISGRDVHEARAEFDRTEEQLRSMGFDVVNPMRLNHEQAVVWSDFMRKDIKALMDCNMIWMLPDWQTSRGAVLEHKIATALGMMVQETLPFNR